LYSEYILIACLVAILSCVQSIFGVGILVFGTPTLLLLGYGFADTLCYLLPSSIIVSTIQVVRPGIKKPSIPKELYFVCLPAIGASLWFTVADRSNRYVTVLVGLILILSALIRMNPVLNTGLTKLTRNHIGIFHLAMGCVHGFTNLGGALLAMFAANLHDQKEDVRYTVAHYYLLFGLLQCLLLVWVGSGELLIIGAMNAPFAALIYMIIGNPMFNSIKEAEYKNGMSVFIFAYGAMLLAKTFI